MRHIGFKKQLLFLGVVLLITGGAFLAYAANQVHSKEENALTAMKQPSSPESKSPQVRLETSLGVITLELYPDKAPLTVKNFLNYVDSGFYDGTIFHRVIPGFMIQGGGMTPGLSEKQTQAPIKNEAANGLANTRGTIAMARTQVVDSATSQFFINVNDNDFLNYRNSTMQGFGYCVFGKVISGMDVADKIVSVATQTSGYYENVPVMDVVIKQAKRVE